MIYCYTFIDYLANINVKMLLQPRTFKHKKIHKKRTSTYHSNIIKLTYGTSGLLLLRTLQLSSIHLTKFKLFLKKAVKKVDKTKRKFWFNGFPHLPLTRKSTGSRMGKGKGKVKRWFIRIKGNSLLFEFKNLRYGKSKYFIKQMSFRINVPTKPIFANKTLLMLPFLRTKKVFLSVLWQ